MSFEYLDTESETLLKEILGYEQLPKQTFRGAVIKNLVELGYVEGKNVIVIHGESIQGFTMNLKFNGIELTPNLNKLASEGLFFSNFYHDSKIKRA